MEKTISEMTTEEKKKFTEETISPLIRYGFQEAISKLYDWIATDPDVTSATLSAKLDELTNNKHEINNQMLLKLIEEKTES